MSKTTIAVLVGSLRKDSLNRQLGKALAELAPADMVLQEIPLHDLPLYNQDTESDPIPSVQHLRQSIKAAQGVIFITPEYNRSISGVLKNAIDHGSRPWGQSVWAGKPAGVIGVAAGALGTAAAQQHLRNILAHMNMPTLGQPEAFIQYKEGLFNADGSIGPASKDFLQHWINQYAAWVKLHAQ